MIAKRHRDHRQEEQPTRRLLLLRKRIRPGHMTGYLLFLLWLMGCASPLTSNPTPSDSGWWLKPGPKALVLTMHGETGTFGLIDIQTRQVKTSVGPVSNDAMARVWKHYVFVVNRLTHDNIQVMELPSYRLIKQYSVGPGSNPQDIAIVNESKAYISRLANNKLLVVKPLTGEVLKELDLSFLAETDESPCQQHGDCSSSLCIQGRCAKDGIAELATMELYQDHLFVTVQRLNRNKRFLAQDTGKLVVIHTGSDQIVKILDMQGINPYATVAKDHLLYVSQPGNWMSENRASLDGLLEVFDMKQLVSKGVILRESSLGGNIVHFAIRSETQGYIIRSGEQWQTELVRFNPSTGQIGNSLKTSPCLVQGACYTYVSMNLHPNGQLFLVDRDPKQPGIRMFDTSTDQELTETPLSTGLPPMNVVFLP